MRHKKACRSASQHAIKWFLLRADGGSCWAQPQRGSAQSAPPTCLECLWVSRWCHQRPGLQSLQGIGTGPAPHGVQTASCHLHSSRACTKYSDCCKSTSQQRTQRCSCGSRERSRQSNQTQHMLNAALPVLCGSPLLPAEPSPPAHQVCCPPLPTVLRVAPHSRLFGCSQAQAARQTRPPGLATAPPQGSARAHQTAHRHWMTKTSGKHCFLRGPAATPQHSCKQDTQPTSCYYCGKGWGSSASQNKDPLFSSAHLQGHHFARVSVVHTPPVQPL